MAGGNTHLINMADTLELKTEKQNAHSRNINSVSFNNDGTKIVSGCNSLTLKVWEVGAACDTAPPPPLLLLKN